MKKNNSTTILPIIVGMISIVWIICILLLANIDGIEFFLWSGFSFAVTDFVLTFLGMKYFASRINDIGVEISIAPCSISTNNLSWQNSWASTHARSSK